MFIKVNKFQKVKKSIAYAIAYRDENKTLNDKDITKVHDKILKALEHKLGAVLR